MRSDFEKGKIGKLLFKLALPCIIAQLVNVLYNIVDRVKITILFFIFYRKNSSNKVHEQG